MRSFYEHAGITIYHGDCREILPHLPRMDAVITDPPYVIRHSDGGGIAGARKFYREGALDGLCDFNLETYRHVLTCADELVVFGSRDQVVEFPIFLKSFFGNTDLHFWHKVNPVPFVNNTWLSDVEYIFLGWKRKSHAKVPMFLKSKVYRSGIDTENLHPTQKPLELIAKYLRVLDPQLILDPFMGSGTTLVAAKNLGRKAIGIEIEEKYCEIASKRLCQEVLDFPTEPIQEPA